MPKRKTESTRPDMLDDFGQPLIRAFNGKRCHDRSVDELIGLAKGMAADGVINQDEAVFLYKWLQRNNEITNEWPGDVLYGRVSEMLADGVLQKDEQKELLELLRSLSGQIPLAEQLENMSTTLPFDDPLPPVHFQEKTFCFTGKFVSGTRKDCQKITRELGGKCSNTTTLKTNYLVIGVIGSRDWIHTSYGRKIEKAMEIRKQNKGEGLYIIPEQYWAEHAYM